MNTQTISKLLLIFLSLSICYQEISGKEYLNSDSLQKLQSAIDSIPVSKLPLKFKTEHDK